MIVPLYPPLDGQAAERFRAFAGTLACAQRTRSKNDMTDALQVEIDWCRSATYLGEGALAYEACVRALTDLVRLRWRIVEQGYGFALENPKEMVGGRPTEEIIAGKESLRAELRPVVDEQLRHPAVLEFIAKMERDDRFGRRSVRLLLADGAELAARLETARTLAGDGRVAALNEAIKPYLQEADGSVDRTTGRRLREIWRYLNSVFGEGTSPKLRKLKMGLRKLGFDPDKLIQHRQHRLIYAAPLFPKAREWLVERTTDLPSYLATPDHYEDATDRIVEFWRRRWLANRLDHQLTMASLPLDAFVPLGNLVAQESGESKE